MPSPSQSTGVGIGLVVMNSLLHYERYLHNGQPHDYVPDFIIRLKTTPVVHLILETKGFDALAEVKAAAAERWVAAVNADGTFGTWRYALARKVEQVRQVLDACM